MNNNGHNIEKTNFDAFINAAGSEIQQAQVRLIMDGEVKSSSNWQRLSGSIIQKRQVIRNATLLICANSHGHIR